MHFGGTMFFTHYSMSAMELARALEERGFESVWALEHSHIPLSRRTPFPGGGDLPKAYYDAMDPFDTTADLAPENIHMVALPPIILRINRFGASRIVATVLPLDPPQPCTNAARSRAGIQSVRRLPDRR
jgi:hypothetical protein